MRLTGLLLFLLPALGGAAVDAPPLSLLEAQVELHRRGFSCGSIDGVSGAQTEAALRAFQRAQGLKPTGRLDEPTRGALQSPAEALAEHTLSTEEIADLQPLPDTWLQKSERTRLGFASLLELLGERYRANPKLLRQLNPEVDWEQPKAGVIVRVPNVEQALVQRPPARLVVRLAARELEAEDAAGVVVAHFPVSIARKVEKRPSGDLKITVVVRDPNYTFDPEVFPESEEAKQLGKKLIIPPGPNNPVGRAWIGLNLSGYGIHGTPDPEKVGRTESHGCFRLANWDALTLLDLVAVGMTVTVEP